VDLRVQCRRLAVPCLLSVSLRAIPNAGHPRAEVESNSGDRLAPIDPRGVDPTLPRSARVDELRASVRAAIATELDRPSAHGVDAPVETAEVDRAVGSDRR